MHCIACIYWAYYQAFVRACASWAIAGVHAVLLWATIQIAAIIITSKNTHALQPEKIVTIHSVMTNPK